MSIINRIVSKLRNLSWKFRGVQLQASAQIFKKVSIINPKNVSIGNASKIYSHTHLLVGKKGVFSMGEHSHFAPYAYLLIDNNQLHIGNHVAIGPQCVFICHSNHTQGPNPYFSQNYLDGDIEIGNNVFIGAQCTILPQTIIGDNIVIASNSVVKGVLKEAGVYGGSPAKKIKDL